MPMLYVILIHNYKWATNEDVHIVHVCMYIHCTVYVFIQANIHSVYSCRLISTHLECNFSP